jgi:hypothetical protein
MIRQLASSPRRDKPWAWSKPACVASLLATSLGLATTASAQPQRQPATQPATQPDRQDRGGDRDNRGFWREPSPEEWEAAVIFLREHNPRRLAIYEAAVEEWRRDQGAEADPNAELPRSIRGARARIYSRVHFLRQLEGFDPELYQFALEQFELEDKIIGSLQDARDAERAGDKDAAARAQAAADEAVRAYAEGTLQEREDRIDRLRRELGREEQRLEQDRSNFDTLVERLKERFERSLPGRGRDDPDRNREGRDGSQDRGGGDGRRERDDE